MRFVLPLLLAAVIGALAAGWIVRDQLTRQQAAAQRKQEQAFTEKIDEQKRAGQERSSELARKLADAQRPVAPATNQIEPRTPPAKPLPTPAEVVQQLQKMNPADRRTKHRVVHGLETLVDLGTASLPAIQEFLVRNEDLEYTPPPPPEAPPRNEEETRQRRLRTGALGNYFQPFPKPENNFPPTLRLGLLEATAHIGGAEAETMLREVLSQTARGVEVAYLDLALEEIAPGKYRDDILKVAREILATPIAVDESGAPVSALDKRSAGYLYAILIKYNDRVFVETAKRILISADGKLDGYALAYLRQVLGEQAMPIFLQAYKDPRVTDPMEKAAIRDAALRYIGSNEQADEIFREMVREGVRDMKGKEFMDFKRYENLFQPIGSLARDLEDQPVESIKARRKLLGEVRKESGDLLLQFGLTAIDRRMAELQEKREKATPQN